MKWLDNLITNWVLDRLTKKVENMNWQWIDDRLHEPSTWKGIIRLVTAVLAIAGVAVSLTPGQVSAIIAAGIAVLGVVDTFRNEKKSAAAAADVAVAKALDPGQNGGTTVILRSPKDQP